MLAGSIPVRSILVMASDKEGVGGIVKRWGGDKSVFAEGFLAVPTTLLKNLRTIGEYGLTPAELVFVLEVMSFKWGTEDPFPSYKRIADNMGVSEGYARKIARGLEEKGFLRRKKRDGMTNKFDLAPLFEEIADLGEEAEGQVFDDESLPF